MDRPDNNRVASENPIFLHEKWTLLIYDNPNALVEETKII